MSLKLQQQLKIAQQIIMTPQLQQAIKLLQLSRLDLMQSIQHELLENPFLEELPPEFKPETAEISETRNENDPSAVYDREIANSADWEDYLGEFSSTPRGMSSHEREQFEEMSSIEGRCAEQPTLTGHLMWQLRLSQLTEIEKEVGEVIIGNLDNSGYIEATNEEIAKMTHTTPETVETVRRTLIYFDPVGIAARSVQECLLIQIEVLGYNRDPILVALIEEHLEDLSNRNYKPIIRKYRIDTEELKAYLSIIQSLDPMPGTRFGGTEAAYVSPDVYVYKVGNEFQIVINDDGLPQLGLSPECERIADKADADGEKDYFAEKLRSASWLIKSLHQRQRTLYMVMSSIVKHQIDFFENGITGLKPLILKDIADDVKLHESTISRVTANKYAATPFGVFELKFFFNSGISLTNGDEVGSESVKALIKKCISEENPQKPLSDDTIADILKEKLQVSIARRTVAKYRTAMDIPSSSQRKVRI